MYSAEVGGASTWGRGLRTTQQRGRCTCMERRGIAATRRRSVDRDRQTGRQANETSVSQEERTTIPQCTTPTIYQENMYNKLQVSAIVSKGTQRCENKVLSLVKNLSTFDKQHAVAVCGSSPLTTGVLLTQWSLYWPLYAEGSNFSTRASLSGPKLH